MKRLIISVMIMIMLSCGTVQKKPSNSILTNSKGEKYILITGIDKRIVAYKSIKYYCSKKEDLEKFRTAEFDFGFVATGLVIYKIDGNKYRCGLEPELEILIEED